MVGKWITFFPLHFAIRLNFFPFYSINSIENKEIRVKKCFIQMLAFGNLILILLQ